MPSSNGETLTAMTFFSLLLLLAAVVGGLYSRRRRRHQRTADAEYLLQVAQMEREEEAVRAYAPHQDF